MSKYPYNQKLTEQVFDVFKKQGEKLINKLSNSVIKSLKSVKDTAISSDEKVLDNLWEEYCVQCQSTETSIFKLYEDAINGSCNNVLDKLKTAEKENYDILVLYHTAFVACNIKMDDDYSISDSVEIADYIISEIKNRACNYSNSRIVKALEY